MRVLDFKGLKCPIPVLKAFKIVKEETEINEFTFLTDDTSAPKDFRDFCKNTGFILISINKKNDHHEIVIKRPNSGK